MIHFILLFYSGSKILIINKTYEWVIAYTLTRFYDVYNSFNNECLQNNEKYMH